MAQDTDPCSLVPSFAKAACNKYPQEKTMVITMPPRTRSPSCSPLWLCQGNAGTADTTTANTFRKEGTLALLHLHCHNHCTLSLMAPKEFLNTYSHLQPRKKKKKKEI